MRRTAITRASGRRFALVLGAASILPLNGASAAEPGSASGGGANGRVQIEGTASALQLGNAFAAVARAVQPAVVFIRVETVTKGFRPSRDMPLSLQGAFAGALPRAATSSGTGFIILPNGYIVTNQHLIDGARRVFVRLFDGREYEAEIVGQDVLSDIAVVRINETNLPTAFLGDSDQMRVGEWVLAIGNPMGSTLMFSVTAGIVSATDRSMVMPNSRGSMQEYIQTDAVANSGNSGGASCGPLWAHRRDELRHRQPIRILPGVHAGHPGQADPPGRVAAHGAGIRHPGSPRRSHLASDLGGRFRRTPRHDLWRRRTGRWRRGQSGAAIGTP